MADSTCSELAISADMSEAVQSPPRSWHERDSLVRKRKAEMAAGCVVVKKRRRWIVPGADTDQQVQTTEAGVAVAGGPAEAGEAADDAALAPVDGEVHDEAIPPRSFCAQRKCKTMVNRWEKFVQYQGPHWLESNGGVPDQLQTIDFAKSFITARYKGKSRRRVNGQGVQETT